MVLNGVGLRKMVIKEAVRVIFVGKSEIQKIIVSLIYDKENSTYNKGLVL